MGKAVLRIDRVGTFQYLVSRATGWGTVCQRDSNGTRGAEYRVPAHHPDPHDSWRPCVRSDLRNCRELDLAHGGEDLDSMAVVDDRLVLTGSMNRRATMVKGLPDMASPSPCDVLSRA
jgi:hypothetical protein